MKGRMSYRVIYSLSLIALLLIFTGAMVFAADSTSGAASSATGSDIKAAATPASDAGATMSRGAAQGKAKAKVPVRRGKLAVTKDDTGKVTGATLRTQAGKTLNLTLSPELEQKAANLDGKYVLVRGTVSDETVTVTAIKAAPMKGAKGAKKGAAAKGSTTEPAAASPTPAE